MVGDWWVLIAVPLKAPEPWNPLPSNVFVTPHAPSPSDPCRLAGHPTGSDEPISAAFTAVTWADSEPKKSGSPSRPLEKIPWSSKHLVFWRYDWTSKTYTQKRRNLSRYDWKPRDRSSPSRLFFFKVWEFQSSKIGGSLILIAGLTSMENLRVRRCVVAWYLFFFSEGETNNTFEFRFFSDRHRGFWTMSLKFKTTKSGGELLLA